jgi:hypothetical protein
MNTGSVYRYKTSCPYNFQPSKLLFHLWPALYRRMLPDPAQRVRLCTPSENQTALGGTQNTQPRL